MLHGWHRPWPSRPHCSPSYAGDCLARRAPARMSPRRRMPPPSTRDPLAEREVFGFLPYWELSRARSDRLRHPDHAGLVRRGGRPRRAARPEDADGEPTPGGPAGRATSSRPSGSRLEAAGVRVVLTVERFSWTTAGKRATKRLLADPEARATLAAEIVEAVGAAGADGVNLDFEPLPPKVRGEFVRLVREVRRALDAVDPSLQLTFDLTPDVRSFPLRRLVADGAADAAVLMGYEYRTPGSRVAGSVAPLRVKDGLDVRESVKLALEKAPAGTVILAMPWYGRAWSTRTDEPDSRTRQGERFIDPSTAFYRVSVPRAASAGREWDAKQGSAWSVYRSRACETCPRELAATLVRRRRQRAGQGRPRPAKGSARRGHLGPRLRRRTARAVVGAALRPRATQRRRAADRERERSPRRASSVSTRVCRSSARPWGWTCRRSTRSAAAASPSCGVARGRRDDDGSLRRGTTFPAVGSVTVSMPDARPVDEVFAPGVRLRSSRARSRHRKPSGSTARAGARRPSACSGAISPATGRTAGAARLHQPPSSPPPRPSGPSRRARR